MKDLRDWLKEVENIGELARIAEEVDWDQEMGAIAYTSGKQIGSPALLFENVKGYPKDRRVLFNMLGSSLNRVALALRMPTEKSSLELIQLVREKMGKRIAPEVIDSKSAPINENVYFGDDVDLYGLPAPKMWPRDGGRYIGSADIVITKDPDDGWLNLGTYRQMIQSKNEVGFFIAEGKDGDLHRKGWWKRGKPCEVAVAYGIDPLLFICGSMGFPYGISEYEYAGGIQGEPVEVVKGEVTDLLIPARAEIVIEGLAYPDRMKEEGPFGEFTGYYGSEPGPTYVIDVKCIHYRNNPIITSALMADYPSCEEATFFSIARAAKVWDDLDALGIPGIKGVYVVPSAMAGFGMIVVSMEQRYPGHASQVAALAGQCPGGSLHTKWVIVVDEDVDPTDIHQVIWAMSTRCSPVDDIDILRNTWATVLNVSLNPPGIRPFSSKALINACKDYKFIKTFAKRSKITEDMYNRVKSKWHKLGLKGDPLEIRAFETFED